jgi:CDGSH-type Zn-finger protein
MNEERGDSVSMSDVVIRSTENGPNLVIVDGKVVQAWCRCGGSTLMPFCDGTHKKNGFMAKTHEVKVHSAIGLNSSLPIIFEDKS